MNMSTKTTQTPPAELFPAEDNAAARIPELWAETKEDLDSAQHAIAALLDTKVRELGGLLEASRTKLVESQGAGAWEKWLTGLGVDPTQARAAIRISKSEGAQPLQLALKLYATAAGSPEIQTEVGDEATWVAKACAGFFRRAQKQPASGWTTDMKADLKFFADELATYAKRQGVKS
jgi:hypothetical protein